MPGVAEAGPPNWPPQFYLIGAQKAGTTSLAGWLGAHPEIALSTPKEPDFFGWNWERGWDWYRACFDASDAKKFLDASTSYSMIPTTPVGEHETPSSVLMRSLPERLFRHRPDARMIYVLRDPIERAFSAYWHYRRLGEEDPPLLEAVVEGSIYERCSLYSRQFEELRAYFPREQFLFVDFRALKSDPQGVVRSCCAFLGVPPHDADIHEAKNRSYSPNVLGRLLLGRSTLRLAQRFRGMLPEPAAQLIKSALTHDVSALSETERVALRPLFKEEYARSVELFGIDFERP